MLLGLFSALLLPPGPSFDPVERPAPMPAQRALDGVWTQANLEEAVASMVREIESLRGRPFLSPPQVELEPREAVRERIRTSFLDESGAATFLGEELSTKLLGLVPGDLDLGDSILRRLEHRVDSYYDSKTQSLFLATEATIGSAELLLARGLTQIFDEQHYGLAARQEAWKDNTDMRLAIQAVASGSASAFEISWREHNHARQGDSDRRTWPTALDPELLEQLPPYLWKPVVAAALRGYTFLQRSSVLSAFLQSVRIEDIEQALGSLPVSTEQILHPVKYWNHTREDLPRSIAFDDDALSDGWELMRADTLGELLLAVMVDPAGGLERARPGSSSPFTGATYTNEASEGWAGDRYLLLRRGSGYLLHLVTVWDEIADAGEFYNAIERRRSALLESLADLDGSPSEKQHGCLLGFGPTHDQVLYTAWVGIPEQDVSEALAHLHYTIAG